MRAWIGIALLSASWLLGAGLYGPANLPAWLAAVAAGTLLLLGARTGTLSVEVALPRREALAALVLLAPVICAATWPYRAGPLLLAAALALALLSANRPGVKAACSAAFTAGLVLIVQGAAVAVSIAGTARSHDAPWPIPQLLAGLLDWLGVEAAADGPYLVTHTMRQTHRLAVTWDLWLDPGTLGFFLGGLVLLGLALRSSPPARERLAGWLKTAGMLALAVVCWLPLRSALLVAVYLQRAMRFPDDWPLHVMNHFFSPWVSAALLAAPVLLAWRLVHPPSGRGEDVGDGDAVPLPPTWRRPTAAVLVLLGAALLASGASWDPVGIRKAGRVKFVERHSTWSPTTRPYDTKSYGEEGSYNYAAAYHWLGQFFEMSQLLESDQIDDATLARCDVLVIKLPNTRYTREEAEAVVRFVARGGGLLLIGDHTNVDRSSTSMNDITRHFGFIFRDDVLFAAAGSPYDEHYEAAARPHPAAAHVPWFDFAVSCSVDPGWSRGRPAILKTGLWSMPADYHMDNFHPVPQHVPQMRGGVFIQAWAARHEKGRVLAFTDSTIFSNFCVFQPGKSELLLNMLEWLNHGDAGLDFSAVLMWLALAPLAAGVWLARRWPAAWLVLLCAAWCGWSAAAAATAAVERRAMPLPAAVRPQARVLIDRTASQVPLAQGAFNEDENGRGFGLLEQWIPRLGYYTVRGQGQETFSGDALVVVIYPSLPADEAFRDRLVRYVAGGGKLLVIDSPENRDSTAGSLLRPFGLSVLRGQGWQGTLSLSGQWPAISVGPAWEIGGGEPVARLGTRPVGATAHYGKGLVMALGFGSLWNDAGMGGDWMKKPDAEMLLRSQSLLAVMQSLVEGKPVVPPAK